MQRLLLFFSVLFIASCDCIRYTKNTVADAETHKVLTNVQVVSVAAMNARQKEQKITYTDSIGSFEASFSVNGVAKCPILKITLTKFNYETLRVVSPRIGDTLFMKRLN